jgi:Fe(3+) dicitrate transport protein
MTRLRDFSILILLLFSLSIAQNKIAGMITDGDGKINAVEIRRQNIKVFTDASGAFEFDLKKSGSFDFVFFKATHCRTKQHYNWQYPHDCAD